MKTLTIRLSDDLHKQLKIHVAHTGEKIQDLVVRLIEDELKKAVDKK